MYSETCKGLLENPLKTIFILKLRQTPFNFGEYYFSSNVLWYIMNSNTVAWDF